MVNIIRVFYFLFSILFACNVYAQAGITFRKVEVPTLYYGCLNKIKIDFPSYIKEKHLSLEVENGEIQHNNSDKSVLNIFTRSDSVQLKVIYKGKVIKQQIFDVTPPPKPTLFLSRDNPNSTEDVSDTLLISSSIRNESIDKVKLEFPKKLQFYFLFDKDFKRNYPKESNYEVYKYEIVLMRGKSELYYNLVVSDTISVKELRKIKDLYEKGDELVIITWSQRWTNSLNKSIIFSSRHIFKILLL